MNGLRITQAALLFALATGNALADVAIYDGFNYPAGQLLNHQSGGTGFTNAWTASQPDYAIQSGSLAFGNLATSGNSVGFTEANLSTDEARRSVFGSGFGNSGTTTWVSFLIRPDSDPTNGLFEFGVENMEVGKVFSDSPNFYAVGEGADIDYSTVPIVQGQTAFVAIEFQFNADPNGQDQATVYFDPTPGLASPNVTGLVWTENFSTSISDFALDAGNGQAFSFDEINFGGTFADVSHVNNPVTTPEPAGIWLFGVVAAYAAQRRLHTHRRAPAHRLT